MAVNSALRKDEWQALDRAVMEAKKQRLNAVNDLKSRGLTQPLGSLGTLTSQWNVASEMTGANVTMTGQSTGERDRMDFDLNGVPIPVIFKEFSIGRRQLEAARRLGDALDTTHVVEATYVVTEQLEDMVINGYSLTFDSNSIYGYTNHPDRNTDTAANYGGGDWSTFDGTAANDTIVPTVAGMINAAQVTERSYGPYVLYVPTTQYIEATTKFYADGSGQTPADRIRSLGVELRGMDRLAAGNLAMVQMTRNTVDWAEAMDVQIMEWSTGDGMTTSFKVMAVAAPRVKSDYNGRIGLVHATGA